MPRKHLTDCDLHRAATGGVCPGLVWGRRLSAGRSDSCAARSPLQDWLDTWQPRGTPCSPISSRACKPHLMTPPASQGFGYWESMRGVWHHQDRRRRGPRELTGIVDLTRGKDHPTVRLNGPDPRQVRHRVQELAGRARKRLARASPNRDAGSPFRDSKNAIDSQLQEATPTNLQTPITPHHRRPRRVHPHPLVKSQRS